MISFQIIHRITSKASANKTRKLADEEEINQFYFYEVRHMFGITSPREFISLLKSFLTQTSELIRDRYLHSWMSYENHTKSLWLIIHGWINSDSPICLKISCEILRYLCRKSRIGFRYSFFEEIQIASYWNVWKQSGFSGAVYKIFCGNAKFYERLHSKKFPYFDCQFLLKLIPCPNKCK